jgi:hypothetical protein
MLKFLEFNTIIVTIDRLTKEHHYLPYNSTINATDLSKIFLCDIWRLYSLPNSIVSNKGSLFAAKL